MTGETEKPRTNMPSARSYGGTRAFFGALLLFLVALLWWRSCRHADAVAIFASDGKIGGVISLRGQLLFAFSNIDMDKRRAWTAQTFSASVEEGRDLRGLLTEGVSPSTGGSVGGNGFTLPADAHPPAISQRWGFLVGRHSTDAFGLPGKWCSIIGLPHWVLLPLGVWPVAGWCARRGRVWRRTRRGWCLDCGYDLRGVEGRCPECGAAVAGKVPPAEMSA